MIYGYCRVSTKGQAKDGNSLEAQEKTILEKYGNAIVYKEAYTGKTTDRPVFNDVIKQLKENDMLVVTKLDRLARNTVEGIKVVKEIFEKKASVHVINVGLLEDTAMGQFFLTTLLAVAELERSQIVERTQTGKAIAKENPEYKEGRPQVHSNDKIEMALQLLETRSYKEVVELTGISKSTLIRAKRKQELKEMTKHDNSMIREIIDQYSNSRNYFEMKQELKRYNLLEAFEESEELQEYLDKSWD